MSDHPPLLAALLDDQGRLVDANAAMVELLGPERALVDGAPLRSFLAPEWRGMPVGDSEETVHCCGRRADSLPWCASLAFWRPPRVGDHVVLTGQRRFGPVRWAVAGEPTDPPRHAAGVDSVVSHDIRGALRGGSGFVTVVKRALEDPSIMRLHERLAKAGDHLDIAARSVASADEIAEKVVHLMRWSVRPFAMQRLPLDQLVHEANRLSNETFTDRPPAVLRLGELPMVVADADQLRWALAELLTNARKFNAGEAGVDIGTEHGADGRDGAPRDDGYTVVSLHDNGIGIDPSLADDALLAGRKLQARGDYPGVGMGLTLCQLIFERHAGWCRVNTADEGTNAATSDRASNGGTTVLFRLPSSSA